MERIRQELDQRWGKGEKLLFGEPWSAGGTSCRPGTVLADKKGLRRLDPETGAFCDATRDAVKGSIEHAESPGFVNGGGLDAGMLANCLRGRVEAEGEFSVRAPSQIITYLSSHDDWTLWDKLVLTMSPDRNFDRLDPELLRANRLAAICFTCQGRLFLLGGEEFARTKQGVRDSVCSPYEINRLDWRRAWGNQGLADYYRGLIALRMRLPGLQDKSAGARITDVEEPVKDCVIARVDNGGGSFLPTAPGRKGRKFPCRTGSGSCWRTECPASSGRTRRYLWGTTPWPLCRPRFLDSDRRKRPCVLFLENRI